MKFLILTQSYLVIAYCSSIIFLGINLPNVRTSPLPQLVLFIMKLILRIVQRHSPNRWIQKSHDQQQTKANQEPP